MPPDKRWAESESLVTSKLDSLEKGFDRLTNEVINLRVNQGKLEMKSGVWGVIGSAIPVVIFLIWEAMKQKGG